MLEAYHRIDQIEEDALKNAILAVLPDSKDDAKSLKEIADEMDLDINTYVDWISVREALVQLPEEVLERSNGLPALNKVMLLRLGTTSKVLGSRERASSAEELSR